MFQKLWFAKRKVSNKQKLKIEAIKKVIFKISLIPLVLLLLDGCKTSKIQPSDNNPQELYLNIYEASRQKQNLLPGTYKRIDTLINNLLESEYTLCHFHNRYDSKHDFSQMHNRILDELAFYSGYSIDFERYIYRKILRNHQKSNSSGEKWRNCMMLFPKRDCGDSDYEHRLNYLAWIKVDTSSIENAEDMLSRISSILDEPCEQTILHMQNEYKWRERFYNNIINQTKDYYKQDEDFDYEFHEVLLNLKDSLSSRFAFDYVMKNNDLPDGIEDIIEDRFKDWDNGNGYTRFQGPPILLSEDEIKQLIERANKIKSQTICDWCDEFIRRLNLRFE